MSVRLVIALSLVMMVGVPSVSADQLDLGNPVQREPEPVEAKSPEPPVPMADDISAETSHETSAAVQVARLRAELREVRRAHARLHGEVRRVMPLLERAVEAGHLKSQVVASLQAAMSAESTGQAGSAEPGEVNTLHPEAGESAAAPLATAPAPWVSPLASDTFVHVDRNIFARQMTLAITDDGGLHLRGELRNLTFDPLLSVGLQCTFIDGDHAVGGKKIFYMTFSEIEQTRKVDVAIDAADAPTDHAASRWQLKVLSVTKLK